MSSSTLLSVWVAAQCCNNRHTEMWDWARLSVSLSLVLYMHNTFLAKAQGVSRLLVTAETRIHSQSVWDLWRKNWRWYRFSAEYLLLPFSFFYYLLLFRFLLFPSIPPIFSSFFCSFGLSSHRLFCPSLYGHSFPLYFVFPLFLFCFFLPSRGSATVSISTRRWAAWPKYKNTQLKSYMPAVCHIPSAASAPSAFFVSMWKRPPTCCRAHE